MQYMGADCLALRSNIWGEFRILRQPRSRRHGYGYAVHVKPSGIQDRRDNVDEERLILCGTLREAAVRLRYEATKHKRYRYY